MKRALAAVAVALVILFCLSGLAVASQAGAAKALPAGTDLAAYPEFARSLTLGEQADLGLRPMRLAGSWTGYNLHRKVEGGRYILETLLAGTLVLAGPDGQPLYKADCGNRLASLSTCPACPPAIVAATLPAASATGTVESGAPGGLWGFLGDALRNLGGFIWNWLLPALLLAAVLMLLAAGLILLAWLVFRLGEALGPWFQRRAPVQPTPVPLSPPTPSVVPVVAPPPTPVMPMTSLPSVEIAVGPGALHIPVGLGFTVTPTGIVSITTSAGTVLFLPKP